MTVQDDDYWVGMQLIDSGMSSNVYTVSNPYWPNVVLKTGAAQDVLKEAQRLDALRHPNIVSLVGIVNHTEATVSNGQPAAFLALAPSHVKGYLASPEAPPPIAAHPPSDQQGLPPLQGLTLLWLHAPQNLMLQTCWLHCSEQLTGLTQLHPRMQLHWRLMLQQAA